MNVQECIEYYKRRVSHKLTKVWLCPQVVTNPKVGKEYTHEINIDANLPASLLNTEVTKHWLEPKDCICMTLRCDDVTYLLKQSSATLNI